MQLGSSTVRSRLLVGGLTFVAAAVLLATPALANPGRPDHRAQAGRCQSTGQAPTGGVYVWGQLCQVIKGKARYPQGVRITVTQNGQPIGTATTDRRGTFAVRVQSNQTYQVSLDPKTLPNAFQLQSANGRTLPAVSTSFGTQRVLFPLGAPPSTGKDFGDFLQLVLLGVKLGLIIAVASVGLSMVYGVTGLVNFAHGELLTFGALVAFLLSSVSGFGEMPLIAAGIIAVVLAGGLGGALDIGLWHQLRRRRTGLLAAMVVSIGLSLLARNVFLIFIGNSPRSFNDYALQNDLHLGPFHMPAKDWWICAICVIVLLAMTGLLKYTRLGTAMRAVADNKDLAEASGIDSEHIIRWVWVFGSALAGLGGVLYGLTQQVSFNMGWLLLLSMFAAVVLGGLGSAYGAILGGLVIGVVQEASTFWINTSYEVAISLLVLILVLLVRPQGILAQRERFG